MQGSSGDTAFTFDGNTAAAAEGAMQSSPGTGTGESEARSGLSQWHTPVLSRRPRTSARSSTSRSGSHRTRDREDRRSRRRSSTRSETPTSIQDRPDRIGGDGHGKRRVSETSGEHSHEGLTEQLQTVNEELTERLQAMSKQIFQLEEAAASRERLIGDIEVKFTDYLRNYNENVTAEIHVLNQGLSESTNELAEYQVELILARCS